MSGDKAASDRIEAHNEDNRDIRGRCFGCQSSRGCLRKNKRDRSADELSRHRRKALILSFRPSVNDLDIPTFRKAGLAQASTERIELRRDLGLRIRAEVAKDRHRWLLRPHNARPKQRRAGQGSKQVSPAHQILHPSPTVLF
jgi:hypothetical protein